MSVKNFARRVRLAGKHTEYVRADRRVLFCMLWVVSGKGWAVQNLAHRFKALKFWFFYFKIKEHKTIASQLELFSIPHPGPKSVQGFVLDKQKTDLNILTYIKSISQQQAINKHQNHYKHPSSLYQMNASCF
jgi:hypothetical protein